MPPKEKEQSVKVCQQIINHFREKIRTTSSTRNGIRIRLLESNRIDVSMESKGNNNKKDRTVQPTLVEDLKVEG